MSLSQLNENIDLLSNNSTNLCNDLTFIPTPINIPDINYPDDREIVKQSLIYGEDFSEEEPKMNEEDAHLIVYGHTNTGSTDVDEEKAMPEDHPRMKFIKNAKKEVNIALKQVKSKGGELISASTLLTIQISSAAATIGSSAIVLPIGSGLPTAFNALMSIFASLEAFLSKLNDLIPILNKLKLLSILLPPSSNPNAIVSPINDSLTTLNTLLNGLSQSAGKVSDLKNKIPIPAGSIDLNGNQTSPEPVNVEIEIKEKSSGFYELKAVPSKGTWKYRRYKWSTSDPNESLTFSNTEFIIVKPQISDGTQYSCEVTDDRDNKGINSVIVYPR